MHARDLISYYRHTYPAMFIVALVTIASNVTNLDVLMN